jgi:hypothetical protein
MPENRLIHFFKKCLQRNAYIAGIVDEILIIHASAGGHLEEQCLGWLGESKKVSALAGAQNQRLWEMGVAVWKEL